MIDINMTKPSRRGIFQDNCWVFEDLYKWLKVYELTAEGGRADKVPLWVGCHKTWGVAHMDILYGSEFVVIWTENILNYLMEVARK